MWARWPQESWISTWFLPLPAGLGQQQDLCPVEQQFPVGFASWPRKRDWARDGGSELSLSGCFCCMSHILPASGIISPAGSIICPFVSIYRLKRRVPVLLLMGLQTAWVELSIWIFTVFGDMGKEHASFLACSPPGCILRVLALVTLCSHFSPVSSLSVKRW